MSTGGRRPLVVHVAAGGNAVGGVTQHLMCLAPRLARHGLDVEVVFLGEGAGPDLARSRGISTEVVRKGGRGDLATIWRLAGLLRERRPDVVHTHTLTTNFYGRFAAILTRVPHRVTTVHSFMGKLLEYDPSGGLGNRLLFRQNQYMNRWSARLIAVSQGVQEWLLDSGMDAGRIRLIRCGIELDDAAGLAANRSRARAEWGLDEHHWVVGNVARADLVKDQMTLLEAALPLLREDRNARLVIAGDGPELARLRSHAEASGAAEQVMLLGRVPEARRLAPAFDVFALSSRMEGISLALLEAMAAGRPVVATDVGGTREVVADGASGLLAPAGSPEALRDALVRLRTDPALGERLGTTARQIVEQSYDADVTSKAIADLYWELIARDGSPRRDGRRETS